VTAATILAITQPEQLFPGDLAAAKKQYRTLSRQWHPDFGGDATVFAHIAKLWKEAEAKLSAGRWNGSTLSHFQSRSGETWSRQSRAGAPFSHGHSLLCDDSVIYIADATTDPTLLTNFHTLNFTYASNRMREEFERYLPKSSTTWLHDGSFYVEVAKTPDLLRLRDVVTHLGPLDPRHTAWIVSSLLNLCCYLAFADLVHGDISPDTYFISPKHHSGALLGGWWYTTARGKPLTLLPRRTVSVLPFKSAVTKLASSQIDLELVRLTAREMSGPMPEPMRTWLSEPGSGGAVEQYGQWGKVLEQTFGKRRFTPMVLDADVVYNHSPVVV
jgi:hypothetical protein